MRIVIDCFKQVKGAGKSIGIYNAALSITQNLVLERDRAEDPRIRDAELVILGNEHNACDFDMEGVHFQQVEGYDPLNKISCVLWELFGVSRVLRSLKADRVLFPRGYCALTHPIKDVVLIHDLIPFHYEERFPGVFGKVENAYIMNRLKASARTAGRIITDSEASKRDIVNYCGVPEEKISVVHVACNCIPEQKNTLCPKEPYICAVTSGLPHKNAQGVLKAYQKYCELAETPLKLVVIGIGDTSICDLPQMVKDRITCHKFIRDDGEMYGVIGGSTAFLFLSLLEGFGLPPIEAMQLQVPVVCSNVSSLPEVVGDAALLVNPESPDEAAGALLHLTTDLELRHQLVRKGLENIKRFSGESRGKRYWEELLL